MPGTSDMSATRATLMQHEQHRCNTSETRATQVQQYDTIATTQVRHDCYTNYTSATQVLHEPHECYTSEKLLILIATPVKTYFHIPIFTIW